MKVKIIACIVLLLSGCANLQSPKETNVAVSALLDEIQIAINEIDKETSKVSGLPPFKSAEVKLSTEAKFSSEGSASLILSGEKSKSSTDSNVLTLELVPNPSAAAQLTKSTGHQIAEYVIAAVMAVDKKGFLKLNSLTVEAGLEVIKTSAGGIEVELVGVAVKGGRSSESTESNYLKLVFANADEKKSE